MKLLTLLEKTKKGKYKADQVYNLYMPNSGEDGVLIGWRGDWPKDHFIEFRGLPYSQWTHDGNDFQRVHDRLAGMRATVLHHNSVVNILPSMPEHEDIARAINGGELPPWDKDRAFNESAQAGVAINYNGQRKVGVKPARAHDDILMTIPTALMDDSFSGSSGFYIGKGGSGNTIGDRYAGFQQWIEEHDEYEVPEVYVHTNGALSFGNGRHRYAVFRDAGVDPMPVAMAREGVRNAEKFMHGVVRESDVAYRARFARLTELRDRDGTARLARAQAMGFDTSKVYYHGTMKDFRAFSKDDPNVDLNFGGAQHVLGHFFASRPNYAGQYAEPAWTGQEGAPNIIPVFLRGKFKAEDIKFIDDIERRNSEDYYAGETEEWVKEIRDRLERAGYDGINFGNGYEIAVFDERNVRSIHAQFNDSDSDQLLAGIGESMLRESMDPQLLRDAAPKALALLRKELAHANVDDANVDFETETGIDGDDPMWDEKFAVWKEGYAQKRIGMAIGAITKGADIRDGNMLVHRMIQADENWMAHITERGLGQYWTWDKEFAEAYGGQSGSESWLITALVNTESIDWLATVFANAHPATGQEEKEITIPEGTPVKVMSIEVNGEEIDPTKWQRGRVLMASKGERS